MVQVSVVWGLEAEAYRGFRIQMLGVSNLGFRLWAFQKKLRI